MRSQTLNRQDAERKVMVVKNVEAATMTTGLGVALVNAGASIDGISSVRSTAAGIRGFVGVAEQDIPVNGYGLVCCFGLTNSVLISNVGTSITVTAGDTLTPGAVAGTFFSGTTAQGLSTVLYRYIIGVDTATISAATYVRGIVRAN